MFVKRRSCSIIVFIPVSILSTEHRLDLKTLTLGQVIRFCSIFRVSDIVFYMDPHASKDDLELCKVVSDYLLTPPYIRKLAIPRRRELRFVGILPPLSIPTHAISKNESVGSVRKGYVLECHGEECLAHVGLDKPCLFRNHFGANVGSIVLLRVESVEKDRYVCTQLEESEIDAYLGPKIHFFDRLARGVSKLCRGGLMVEFTKSGLPPQEVLDRIPQSVAKVCAVFGSPKMDVSEILRLEEGVDVPTLALSISSKHIAVDAVVDQGVKSIRTVEALCISLAVLNTIMLLKSVCT